ncbi:MAG: FAD-dependent oxidoreductase [Candidatus Omnitrophota bacterium]
MRDKTVYIIGGGITSLVTAYELLRKGIRVTIVEKLDKPGGLLRTLNFRESYVDLGPKLFHTFNKNIIRYLKDLALGIFLEKQFWCKNFKDGKLYDYPLALSTIKEFPPELQRKIKKELRVVNLSARSAAINYKEYVESLVGPTLQKLFYEDYPSKIWGMKTTDMITNWAPKRIELRNKYEAFYYNQWCAVCRRGSGQIVDILKEKIERMSGKILLNSEVTSLDVSGDKVLSFKINKRTTVKLKDDLLISTIPLNHLTGMLSISNNLQFRSVIFVFLKFRKPFIFKDKFDWLYFDDPNIAFHRVTEQKRFSPEGLPKDRTTLCFEIACDKNDKVYKNKDKDLINNILVQFTELGFVSKDDFIEGKVERVDEVYPKYYYGYEMEFSRINSALSKIKNLYNCGSLAEFHYSDIQILFAKAVDLAELISNESYSKNINIREGYKFGFNKMVNIAGKLVGEGHKPFIIAEAGLNHNGDIDIARKLIRKAKEIGCDAIKFQTFKAGKRVSAKVKSANYFEKTLSMEENYYEMFSRLEFTEKDFRLLYQHARSTGIPFFSTPFSEEDVDILERIGVGFYKVASFDLVNHRLLSYIASKQKPVILSTGMSNLAMVEEALEAIARTGNKNVVLLHCVSDYPMHLEDANLRAIDTLKAAFRLPVGYSDHSIGLLTSNLAMAMGADVIERHFTLNKYLEGPDHILSSDPAEMSELVINSIMIPQIIGDGIKRIRLVEFETINKFRKSLFAARDLVKGETLNSSKIEIKGPGHGIMPKYIDLIIGRKTKRAIPKDYPITWNDV